MHCLIVGFLLIAAGIVPADMAVEPEYEIPKSTHWEFRSIDEGRIVYTEPGILQWWTNTRREIADSLVLPWPADMTTLTSDVTLVLSASIQSESDKTYLQFSEKKNGDLFLIPFPYTSTTTSLPHSETPNCISFTDSITTTINDFHIRGDSLIIRVINEQPEEHLSLVSITELYLEDDSSRIDILPVPVISESSGRDANTRVALPIPIPIMGQWILWYELDPPVFDPSVLNGSFVLRQDSRPFAPDIFMRVQCAGNQYDFQPAQKESITVFSCYLDDHYDSESSFCRLYLFIPVSPESGDTTVIDALRYRQRSTCVQSGDLVINEIIHSPDSRLIIELRNTRNWPLEITDATLSLDDTAISLPAMGTQRVEEYGYLCATGDILIDLREPPDRLEIRLWADSTCIDSLRCGILDSLPIPPENHSLSRTETGWTIESNPSPGVVNTTPGHDAVRWRDIILSEIYLWDNDESAEFVELMNISDSDVDISGWKLLANDMLPVQTDTLIAPGCTYVIHGIPESFEFEVEFGSLYLIDRNGIIIDRYSWKTPPPAGRSFHRLTNDSRETIEYEEGIPTPGHACKTDVSPREVHVTHTHNGIVLQWACGRPDTSTFEVFRSEPGADDRPIRVSTFPVVGTDPFSFVDLTADPDTDYSYWIVFQDRNYEDLWFGPYTIRKELETMPISIAVPRPNPFSDVLFIEYDIGTLTEGFLSSVETDYKPGRRMTLAVYSIDGRLVKTLDRDILNPGSYSARWDGTNELGSQCPPGVYLISLQLGPYTESVRTVFMKKQ